MDKEPISPKGEVLVDLGGAEHIEEHEIKRTKQLEEKRKRFVWNKQQTMVLIQCKIREEKGKKVESGVSKFRSRNEKLVKL